MHTKIRRSKSQSYHHGDLRRALIETALQLVTEEQDWSFALREVARRAGVSHRAPYNHFPEKLDLLAAVAAVGFERLRDRMVRALAGIDGAEALLVAIVRTYVRVGLENPALYRLMFGPALSEAGSVDRPTVARAAGAEARAVLEDVILRGARSGAFAVSPDSAEDVSLAALVAWSAAHGLTMFAIDRIPRADLSVDDMIDRLLRMVVTGLRQGAANSYVGRLPPRSDIERRTSSRSGPAASQKKRTAK
jgi:AcrR family transcriptional regulator